MLAVGLGIRCDGGHWGLFIYKEVFIYTFDVKSFFYSDADVVADHQGGQGSTVDQNDSVGMTLGERESRLCKG
jgi:hypothetical protein